MKNEFRWKIPVGSWFVLLAVLGYFYNLSTADDELDMLGSLVALSAMAGIVVCLIARRHRRGAVWCGVPDGDLPGLLSRLSVFLGEFGYRAVETGSWGRWAFEAPARGPFGGLRKVWVECAETSYVRIAASRAMIREIRRRFPEAVPMPYTGPQFWVARGNGLLVPGAVAATLSILALVAVSPAGFQDAIRFRMAALKASREHVALPTVVDASGKPAGGWRGGAGGLPEEDKSSTHLHDILIPLELSAEEASQGGARKMVKVPGRGRLAVMIPRGVKSGWRLHVPASIEGNLVDLYIVVTVK
jgi:hypothetical protein